MPEGSRRPRALAAVLFLGDASPFGLSVARAAIESGLAVRAVLASRPSYRSERIERGGLAGRALRTIRRGLHPRVPEDLVSRARPIPPLVPDAAAASQLLREACAERSITWRRLRSARPADLAAQIAVLEPDLILSAAFPWILPDHLLRVPRLGAVNVHPSLLPRCRGCHPIFWTLADAEARGGVTAHFMTGTVDAGPIVVQEPLPIGPEEDYRSLYLRAMEAGARIVGRVEAFFRDGGDLEGVPQDDARATHHGADSAEDRRVRWEAPPAAIEGLSRTCQAWTWARGEAIGVLGAHPSGGATDSARPGAVVAITGPRDAAGSIVVAAGGGTVSVPELSWRGRIFPAAALATTLGLAPGSAIG